jgi:hypothetical protein
MKLVYEICKVCDFYKENEEQLECGAYKILKILVRDGKIGLEDIRVAVYEISSLPNSER